LPGQAAENPDGEIVDGEEEWEVEQVVASRVCRNKLQYQAIWAGWDPDDQQWYDAESFKNATAKLRDFHEKNPDQAGPPARLEI
jgi:hypothetical protein